MREHGKGQVATDPDLELRSLCITFVKSVLLAAAVCVVALGAYELSCGDAQQTFRPNRSTD